MFRYGIFLDADPCDSYYVIVLFILVPAFFSILNDIKFIPYMYVLAYLLRKRSDNLYQYLTREKFRFYSVPKRFLMWSIILSKILTISPFIKKNQDIVWKTRRKVEKWNESCQSAIICFFSPFTLDVLLWCWFHHVKSESIKTV